MNNRNKFLIIRFWYLLSALILSSSSSLHHSLIIHMLINSLLKNNKFTCSYPFYQITGDIKHNLFPEFFIFYIFRCINKEWITIGRKVKMIAELRCFEKLNILFHLYEIILSTLRKLKFSINACENFLIFLKIINVKNMFSPSENLLDHIQRKHT